MISSGLLAWLTASSNGTRLLALEIFSSWISTRAFSNSTICSSWLVTKCGERIAAIELHAFDDVDGRFRLLALLDGDHAVFADLHEGVGQHGADRRIVVAGDRGDLHDLLLVLLVDRRGHLADGGNDRLGRLLDAAGQRHRIGAAGDHLQAFAIDGLGQHGGRGGAVAGDLVGLARRPL